MKILITGGAGFIGNALIHYFLDNINEVKIVNIDNFDQMKEVQQERVKEHFIKGKGRYKLFRIDVSEKSSLFEELGSEDPDIIIHLAAKAGVRSSINNPEDYIKTNVMGTQNILDLAKFLKVSKVIFASSSSVYGNNNNLPWKESDLNLNPISPYAATKLAGEKLCQVYAHLYNINVVVLRFFTVYGPGQRPDLAIHKFFRLLNEGIPIPFFGEGSTKRDYTYIDDIISGIVGAISYKGYGYDIFNLGSNKAVSLLELVDVIENIWERKITLDIMPNQPGDVAATYADITKAKLFLGYVPTVSLGEGIAKFYEWFILSLKKVKNKDFILK